jgi:hypothetical protein
MIDNLKNKNLNKDGGMNLFKSQLNNMGTIKIPKDFQIPEDFLLNKEYLLIVIDNPFDYLKFVDESLINDINFFKGLIEEKPDRTILKYVPEKFKEEIEEKLEKLNNKFTPPKTIMGITEEYKIKDIKKEIEEESNLGIGEGIEEID